MQGRGGEAGRRPGGGAAETGGARLPARRAGGLRPVCLRLLQRWRGGAKNSPVFLIPGMVESNNSIKQNRNRKLHQHINSEDCHALCKKEFLIDLLSTENVGCRHRTGWEKKCDRCTGADDRKGYRIMRHTPRRLQHCKSI